MQKVHLIGNAHIDPVWLWTWREGFHEIKATFRSALDRMIETPGYIFTCACASYYEWVEENAPEMFEKIKQRVQEGRWKIVGGMWVQPDMNSLSGESIARHLLISQRYFQEKFGVTVKTGYNVDTFGHNGQLPQLMNLAGIVNYVWMRPMMNENAQIPEGALVWKGVDGSGVKAFRIPDSYTGTEIVAKIEKTIQLAESLNVPLMCFYGVGNHGGGPTKKLLSEIEARRREKGDEEVCYSSPDAYFDAIEGMELPVWTGELQHHASGCYSTFADSKILNRKAENALLSAEAFSVLAHTLKGHAWNSAKLEEAWKTLLFNQFHDLLGGCSIRDAMDDMLVQQNAALFGAQRVENAALQKISWNVDTVQGNPKRIRSKEGDWMRWHMPGESTPVVVFNPHSFEASGSVHLTRPSACVRDDDGNIVPFQIVRAQRTNGSDKWDSLFRVKVPPMGYRLYWVATDGEEQAAPETGLSVSGFTMENEFVRVSISPETGEVMSLFDKKAGYEALKKPARAALMDIEHCDTWAHNVFKFDQLCGEFADAKVWIAESGPARCVIRAVSKHEGSTLTRDYILACDAKHVEVQAKIDTHEPYRMFKVCLPVNAGAITPVSEIPYAAIERKAEGEEDPCQRWALAQGEKGGIAVLNSGAYSYSAQDGEIRMTFLNTSAFADHYGQNDRDAFVEHMQMGETRFSYALLPFAGAWQEAGIPEAAALFNEPLKWVVETYHEGELPGEYSGIGIACGHVMARAIKRSENGSGYVVRLYETSGKPADTEADFAFAKRKVYLSFRPYEIKTLYLPDNAQESAKEIDIPEFKA